VAAVSLVVAVLSLGFAVVQSLRRPEPAPAMVAVPPAAADNTQPRLASTGAGSPSLASVTNNGAATESRREIQRTSRVLEPNYTVQAGDTLNRIAARFDTTVERIQAWNDLPDPRALRVGAKLVIPPPL
jgi:LysM repeat protein